MIDYTIKNPKSVSCCTALSGGTTLESWDIEDDKFYANEGKKIMTRNLWASIPNLLMGFAVWLMWSVTVARIQIAHDADPSAYYFKDFAGEFMGKSDGYRARPAPHANPQQSHGPSDLRRRPLTVAQVAAPAGTSSIVAPRG